MGGLVATPSAPRRKPTKPKHRFDGSVNRMFQNGVKLVDVGRSLLSIALGRATPAVQHSECCAARCKPVAGARKSFNTKSNASSAVTVTFGQQSSQIHARQ
jgi:hypothetical protein